MLHPTDRIIHTTAFVTPVVEYWLEQEKKNKKLFSAHQYQLKLNKVEHIFQF